MMTSSLYLNWKDLFSVFVGNIHTDVTEEELVELFSVFGDIKHYVLKRPKNNSRFKFGFFRYQKEEESLRAIDEGNGWPLRSYPILVEKAGQLTKNTNNADKKKPRNAYSNRDMICLVTDPSEQSPLSPKCHTNSPESESQNREKWFTEQTRTPPPGYLKPTEYYNEVCATQCNSPTDSHFNENKESVSHSAGTDFDSLSKIRQERLSKINAGLVSSQDKQNTKEDINVVGELPAAPTSWLLNSRVAKLTALLALQKKIEPSQAGAQLGPKQLYADSIHHKTALIQSPNLRQNLDYFFEAEESLKITSPTTFTALENQIPGPREKKLLALCELAKRPTTSCRIRNYPFDIFSRNSPDQEKKIAQDMKEIAQKFGGKNDLMKISSHGKVVPVLSYYKQNGHTMYLSETSRTKQKVEMNGMTYQKIVENGKYYRLPIDDLLVEEQKGSQLNMFGRRCTKASAIFENYCDSYVQTSQSNHYLDVGNRQRTGQGSELHVEEGHLKGAVSCQSTQSMFPRRLEVKDGGSRNYDAMIPGKPSLTDQVSSKSETVFPGRPRLNDEVSRNYDGVIPEGLTLKDDSSRYCKTSIKRLDSSHNTNSNSETAEAIDRESRENAVRNYKTKSAVGLDCKDCGNFQRVK